MSSKKPMVWTGAQPIKIGSKMMHPMQVVELDARELRHVRTRLISNRLMHISMLAHRIKSGLAPAQQIHQLAQRAGIENGPTEKVSAALIEYLGEEPTQLDPKPWAPLVREEQAAVPVDVEPMPKAERMVELEEIITSGKPYDANGLAKIMGVSASTIRRDLSSLLGDTEQE